MESDLYARIVEWHRTKRRAEELREQLEDVFSSEEPDYGTMCLY